MSQKVKIRLFLGMAIICWAAIACWAMYTHQQGSAVDPIYDTIHGDIYSTIDTFQIYQGEPNQKLEGLSGAIVANPLNNPTSTGETMALLRHNIDGGSLVIVAFGDNVGSQGLGGDWAWQGSYGVVQTDKGLSENLKNAGLPQNNRALGNVEDMSLLMDYLSYYLPGVSIVPIVLDNNNSVQEINTTLGKYRDIIGPYPLIVVTPQSEQESTLNFNIPETTISIKELRDLSFSHLLQPQAAKALTVLDALALDEGNIHVFPTTDYSGEEPVEKSSYFSDLQIFYEK